MDSLNTLTRHLIIASGKLDLKFPERKEIQVPSIMETPFFNLVNEKPKLEVPQVIQAKLQIQEAPHFSTGIEKIDSLLSDPQIGSIHCEPFQALKVKKGYSIIPTDIHLNDSEVDQVIKKFSDFSKTPLTPIFRSQADNHSILSVSSPLTGTRFLILRL